MNNKEFELTGFVVYGLMSFTITGLKCKRFILRKLMLDKKEMLSRSTLCFKILLVILKFVFDSE